MASNITLNQDDLGVLLIGTTRYALGRQSYFPALAINMLVGYGRYLSENDRDVIIRDIEEYLKIAKTQWDKSDWGYALDVLKHWK
jgi:hypothetical protein